MSTPPWLQRILDPNTSSFALLHRPGSAMAAGVDLLIGQSVALESIADIPFTTDGGPGHEVLAVMPYRQIGERGFEFPDDGCPLLAMSVQEQSVLALAEVLQVLPSGPVELIGGGFDADDAQYARTVQRILTEEIGQGTGANFVIKRTYCADVSDWSTATALAFYRRLLGRDPGAHWTFLVRAGGRTFIGSSPERHVTVQAGTVTMNPISGTYPYPEGEAQLPAVLDFLADRKEAGELYMVLDEELKMMGRVCELGGRVSGPHLKQMARVAHTEYLIEGHSTMDVRDILRETLFAPTVTGGPLESACRVIARFEPEGRAYYAGAIALIGRDGDGRPALDSTIAIRTADIDSDGHLRLSVGATLVRDSDPAGEAAETRAKAEGLLRALSSGQHEASTRPHLDAIGQDPAVTQALALRNRPLAPFWFDEPKARSRRSCVVAGTRLLVIDAEDTFTAMARHLLASLGFEVTVARFDEDYRIEDHHLVIVGPGPGDPTDVSDPKIARLRAVVADLLGGGTPFFAVCLGHQVLSSVLGLDIVRRPVPNQGVQRTIDFFGEPMDVGFYNTFSASLLSNTFRTDPDRGAIQVLREGDTDEVHALRGPGFASVQFHPASILTPQGAAILARTLRHLLSQRGPRVPMPEALASLAAAS